jgi:hypothetical protein
MQGPLSQCGMLLQFWMGYRPLRKQRAAAVKDDSSSRRIVYHALIAKSVPLSTVILWDPANSGLSTEFQVLGLEGDGNLFWLRIVQQVTRLIHFLVLFDKIHTYSSFCVVGYI